MLTHCSDMADFDPEQFQDKYANYFPELQQAYKNAFNRMNDRYDSELVHAIDQQVLNESEPFYEGDGEFRVELPEEPYERLRGTRRGGALRGSPRAPRRRDRDRAPARLRLRLITTEHQGRKV